MASRASSPSRISAETLSIIKIALFTITPISIISPMNETTLSDMPLTASAKKPPVNESGIESIMISGLSSDSNWQAITA